MSGQHAAARPANTRLRRYLWALYLLLLAMSFAMQFLRSATSRLPGMDTVEGKVTVQTAASNGRTPREATQVAYRAWPMFGPGIGGPSRPDPNRSVVILIHGSPGSGADFSRLAVALEARGYCVIAPDLPGFGRSDLRPPRMSAASHAQSALAMMDALHIPRAHIVGWSLGGAVALNIADLAPDRVASLTLMASVSEQATEGSGNYYYEHGKYAAGWSILTAIRYGIPHFGLLSGLDTMRASMRNFWDTDLRPLHGIMERTQTPTLIIHGWRDFLAPVHDSFRSHELIGPSTLVLFDGTHFIPFMHVQTATSVLIPFFERHDTPGIPGLRQTVMLNPEPPPILGPPGAWLNHLLLAAPWWLIIALVAIGITWRDRLTAVLAILPVTFALLDFGVVMGGLLLGQALLAARSLHRGRALRPTNPRIIGSGILARTPDGWRALIRRRPFITSLASRFVPGYQATFIEAVSLPLPEGGGWGVGSFASRSSEVSRFILGIAASWIAWSLLFAITTLLAAALIVHPLADRLGAFGLLAATLIAIYLPRPIALLLTRSGRHLLRIKFHRATRREYWPTLLQYALLSPVLLRMSARHGLLAYTCCNPGISGGGGMIGESKKTILDSLAHSPHALPAALIETNPDPATRIRAALDAISTRPELGGLPIILKPDAGQRGFAVKIARTPEDVEAYFQTVTSPVLIQRYHPGPCECGIVWMRLGSSALRAEPITPDQPTGSIFSITRKTFPILTGDGRRTLEQLILRHPRYHCQAAVFLERFADQRTRILADGETLRLAQSGNHCQGTLFTDGADLITPELESAIDHLARSVTPPLDAGRFDLRYESDDSLRRGHSFAIVELNGTAGESTNIYDPNKSILWAYRTLAAQWRQLYELGAERQRQGAKPLTPLAFLRELRKHYRERTGSALAD